MSKMVSVANYHTPGIAGRKGLGKATPLANSFSLIEYNQNLRFLIMDCPTNSTIPLYLKEFDRLHVTDVVRVCEPTYAKERLNDHNVQVHDLPFKDGDVPPSSVLKKWLELVTERRDQAMLQGEVQPVPTTIAVHCVAGLGRAPVLVAVALIEKGVDVLDAIEFVRRKRRGAFNNRQITYLADQYKRSSGSKSSAKIAGGLRSSPANSASGTPTSGSPQVKTNSIFVPSNSSNGHKSFFKKMFGSH